jgi:hypothetical protein
MQPRLSPPASASSCWDYRPYATTSFCLLVCFWFFGFDLVPGIESRACVCLAGTLPLSYISSGILFYFETAFH